MTKKTLLYSLITGIGLMILILWFLGSASGDIAHAQSSSGTIHVAKSGNDDSGCGSESSPCQTIQYAIDLSQGGEQILVAAGVYTDVHLRNTITQVVYIDKDLALRGGYTTTNWTTPNPINNPTILNAEGQGRVAYIAAGISTTLNGLHITGGNATGLRGDPRNLDAGGGVYAAYATITLSDCQIYNNTGSTSINANGGGVFIHNSHSSLSHNMIMSNTASTVSSGEGGGVYLFDSIATLEDNTIAYNIASVYNLGGGGGVGIIYASVVTLTGNSIMSNTASLIMDGYGGGLYLFQTTATLIGNRIQGNIASESTVYGGAGGGLNVQGNDITLDGNLIIDNIAAKDPNVGGQGGAMWVQGCELITLTNNLFAGNHANTQGSGLWFGQYFCNANLIHNTIADNEGSGQGMYVATSTLFLTNTILSGQNSVGITVTENASATLEATLWHDNGINIGGDGSMTTGTINIYDDPLFVDPSAWDYHLRLGSPAIDAGVAAGVVTDFDGQSRPMGSGYDLGADEWLPLPKICFLPIVMR